MGVWGGGALRKGVERDMGHLMWHHKGRNQLADGARLSDEVATCSLTDRLRIQHTGRRTTHTLSVRSPIGPVTVPSIGSPMEYFSELWSTRLMANLEYGSAAMLRCGCLAALTKTLATCRGVRGATGGEGMVEWQRAVGLPAVEV